MKTFLEYTDDRAAIEAELKSRGMWEEWQYVKMQATIGFDDGISGWRSFYENTDGTFAIFSGTLNYDTSKEEWFWINIVDTNLPPDIVLRIFDHDVIADFLENTTKGKAVTFFDN